MSGIYRFPSFGAQPKFAALPVNQAVSAADHVVAAKATASTRYAARLGNHASLLPGRVHGHRADCLPIIRQLAPFGATSRRADQNE